jgi:uncharacterized membrane protein
VPLVLAIGVLLAGCSSGDRTLDSVDPQAVVADPTYDQVFAIIQNNCVSCHGGSGEGEGDYALLSTRVLEDVPGFETCASIVALRDDILGTVEANTMPPGALPRLTNEQKLTIRRWVENGAPAPCN